LGRLHIILIGLMLVPALSTLESAFDGAFRPYPEKPNQPGKMGESFAAWNPHGKVAPRFRPDLR
jgi:hypothetical protein